MIFLSLIQPNNPAAAVANRASGQVQSAISIIPEPESLKTLPGEFTISANTSVIASGGAVEIAEDLQSELRPATGYNFKIVSHGSRGIEFALKPGLKDLGTEGYQLTVSPTKISIIAPHQAGLFYGLQTLRQLLPTEIYRKATVSGISWTVPCVNITDQPRYHWRGTMLDVCRHFMPKEFVLKMLDLVALHKMNVFHWHLTDDQGWRIQIPQYPKLTEVGGFRKGDLLDKIRGMKDENLHGGFYTEDDIREVVAYAKKRFITVVPEIEMPGHSSAAIAAYPWLGNTGKQYEVPNAFGVMTHVYTLTPRTVQFCKDVLTEVMKLFPSQFIHVGGDEVPTDEWAANPDMQAKMKQLGITDPRGLQTWFTHQLDEFLTAHGRRLIGWDEILEGGTLAKGATVMSWRGTDGGIAAAKAGHDVVMAPTDFTYFDYKQSKNDAIEPVGPGAVLPIETVYSYNPDPTSLTAEQRKHILGVSCQLWTEYVPDVKHAEYMDFPRMCALSEVAWSPQSLRNWDDFKVRLLAHLPRLKALDVNYRVPDFSPETRYPFK